MLRILGLIGLVTAAGVTGMLQASRLKDRISLLEEFYKMVLYLKGQMEYFREPLLRMFARAGKKGETKAQILLCRCADDLQEKDDEISHIWAENMKQVYCNTPLTAEDKTLLLHLGSFIGQTDYENQKSQFTYMEERLTEQITEARDAYLKKGPMYRRIGFFGGIIAALIVL